MRVYLTKSTVWAVEAEERKRNEAQKRKEAEAKRRAAAEEVEARKEQMRQEVKMAVEPSKS